MLSSRVRFWPVMVATVALTLAGVGMSAGVASAATPVASKASKTCKEQDKVKINTGGAKGYDYVGGNGGQLIPAKSWVEGTCLSLDGYINGNYIKDKNRWKVSPGWGGDSKYFYKVKGESVYGNRTVYVDEADFTWPSKQ